MQKISDMLDAKRPIVYNGEIVGETDDYTAINAAITTFAKLTGDFAAEKQSIVVTEMDDETDLSKMTEEEKIEYKKKILKELQS